MLFPGALLTHRQPIVAGAPQPLVAAARLASHRRPLRAAFSGTATHCPRPDSVRALRPRKLLLLHHHYQPQSLTEPGPTRIVIADRQGKTEILMGPETLCHALPDEILDHQEEEEEEEVGVISTVLTGPYQGAIGSRVGEADDPSRMQAAAEALLSEVAAEAICQINSGRCKIEPVPARGSSTGVGSSSSSQDQGWKLLAGRPAREEEREPIRCLDMSQLLLLVVVQKQLAATIVTSLQPGRWSPSGRRMASVPPLLTF